MRAGGGFDRGRGRRGRNDNGRGGGRGRGRGTILCTFYLRGLCTRGSKCRFLHDNIPEPDLALSNPSINSEEHSSSPQSRNSSTLSPGGSSVENGSTLGILL